MEKKNKKKLGRPVKFDYARPVTSIRLSDDDRELIYEHFEYVQDFIQNALERLRSPSDDSLAGD